MTARMQSWLSRTCKETAVESIGPGHVDSNSEDIGYWMGCKAVLLGVHEDVCAKKVNGTRLSMKGHLPQ